MSINSTGELRILSATLSLTVLSTVLVMNFNIAFSQNEDVSYLDVNGTNSVQLSKFSVAAWFKTSNDYNTNAFIVNKAGASDNMNYGVWMTNSETIRGGFETSSGSAFYATSPLSYSDGNWHYAVVTFDGSAIGLYIDGLPVATKSASAQERDTQLIKTLEQTRRLRPPNLSERFSIRILHLKHFYREGKSMKNRELKSQCKEQRKLFAAWYGDRCCF